MERPGFRTVLSLLPSPTLTAIGSTALGSTKRTRRIANASVLVTSRSFKKERPATKAAAVVSANLKIRFGVAICESTRDLSVTDKDLGKRSWGNRMKLCGKR